MAKGRLRNITDPVLDTRLEALRLPAEPGGRIRSFSAVVREVIETGLPQLEARRALGEAYGCGVAVRGVEAA